MLSYRKGRFKKKKEGTALTPLSKSYINIIIQCILFSAVSTVFFIEVMITIFTYMYACDIAL